MKAVVELDKNAFVLGEVMRVRVRVLNRSHENIVGVTIYLKSVSCKMILLYKHVFPKILHKWR